MLLPNPPGLIPLEHISPSIYEAALSCPAKAAWYSFGDAGTLPEHPAALLGLSFHAVIAAAHRGELRVASESDRSSARVLFDETVRTRHRHAHQLLRLKFPVPERLPYYNLRREHTALLATRIAASRFETGSSLIGSGTSRRRQPQTESRLVSRDGMIAGRPDHIDRESELVIDYKSGHAAEADADSVSPVEARQLRLYAYLAAENGVRVSKGAIIRADGRRCELPITPDDAEREASNARTQIQRLNDAIRGGATFGALASPSPQNCRSCPCIPFCDAFWAAAKPEWHEECGSHIAGQVSEIERRQVQGVSLTTLILVAQAGTVAPQRVSVEQIPSEWMALEAQHPPRQGESVRVVHGRQLENDRGAVVVRPDRVMTAVWFEPSSAAAPNRAGARHG